jgi:hypothetical protein
VNAVWLRLWPPTCRRLRAPHLQAPGIRTLGDDAHKKELVSKSALGLAMVVRLARVAVQRTNWLCSCLAPTSAVHDDECDLQLRICGKEFVEQVLAVRSSRFSASRLRNQPMDCRLAKQSLPGTQSELYFSFDSSSLIHVLLLVWCGLENLPQELYCTSSATERSTAR